MKPITFSCTEVLGISADEVVQQILDLTNWPDFRGYGFLPGIKAATFEDRTPDIVGSRIKVTNTDGSSHVEEVVEFQPDRRLTLHMKEFSPPVSRLAIRFDETWDFEPISSGTKVTRSFRLYAKSAFTRPLLWVISFFLKKAVWPTIEDSGLFVQQFLETAKGDRLYALYVVAIGTGMRLGEIFGLCPFPKSWPLARRKSVE